MELTEVTSLYTHWQSVTTRVQEKLVNSSLFSDTVCYIHSLNTAGPTISLQAENVIIKTELMDDVSVKNKSSHMNPCNINFM